jgi:putative endonuclease
MSNKIMGRLAEDIASEFLKQRGYKIIQRNFRCRLGEIDNIAKDKDEFVIVEVRSSSGSFLPDPLESIGYVKKERLKKLALVWLYKNRLDDVRLRFDTVTVIFRNGGNEINHIAGTL